MAENWQQKEQDEQRAHSRMYAIFSSSTIFEVYSRTDILLLTNSKNVIFLYGYLLNFIQLTNSVIP